MKIKTIMVLGMLVLFTSTVHSIVHIKGGLESSRLSFSLENNDEWGKSGGFRFGTGFTSLYERKFVFQPELYFVRKGAKQSGSFEGSDMSQQIRLNCLELPMLFRFSVLNRDNMNIGLFIGPYASIILSASQATSFNHEARDRDLQDDFKKTDFGTVLGIEMVLIRKKFNYFLDLRITSGLTNIRENRDFQDIVKTRSLTLSAGIGF